MLWLSGFKGTSRNGDGDTFFYSHVINIHFITIHSTNKSINKYSISYHNQKHFHTLTHHSPQADYSDHVQRDLLDALLRAKRSAENNNTAEISAETVGLSDDHVLMTVGDIFGAGVETTTTVLKWAIMYLIHNPQVRDDSRLL